MKKNISSSILILFVVTFAININNSWAWTNENHWEEGDSINWDVPYQTQSSFRNWTTSCMATSGAMVVNFFYAGAKIVQFHDIHESDHPWEPINVNHLYETTGQRRYSK